MNAYDGDAGKRTVRLFRNGRSQAVRIPREWEFEGDEVVLRKGKDDTVTIEPVRPVMSPREIVEWLRREPPLTDADFPAVGDSDMKPLDDIGL